MPKKRSGKKKVSAANERNRLQNLEKELERAIAEVVERDPDLPIGPDQPTMHFMAKAAVAAYEAALQQTLARPE